MVAVDSIQLLILQIAIAFIACLFFVFAGALLCSFVKAHNETGTPATSNKMFYNLLAGMVFAVTMYAIVISGFKTIYSLIVLSAIACFWNKIKLRPRLAFPKMIWRDIVGLLLLVTIFVVILNFLPESENKQQDSFYYLKITEALNATGQENTNNYYNLLSKKYHGVEMYHYFECWLSGFLLWFTQSLMPNIQNFRIVTFAIISVVFCYGLFSTYELIAREKPGLLRKIFCVCFIFFSPDVVYLLPESINYYLVYNFENNYLERPNLRLVYLFCIPVFHGLLKNQLDRSFVFFTACFCLMNPTVIAMALPAFLFLVTCQYLIQKDPHKWLFKTDQLLIFTGFLVAYVIFYGTLSVKNIPPMYEIDIQKAIDFFQLSWRFVLLTIITGILYVSMFLGIAWLICYKLIPVETAEFISKNKSLPFVGGALILSGILVARSFVFVENLVQVSFNSYIIVSLLIFMLFVPLVKKSWKFAVVSITFFLAGYTLHKTYVERTESLIFNKNDRFSYAGKEYSKKYVDDVLSFAVEEKNILGGFIADSTYYQDLFYSLRNPNVYHLPITYILANKARVNDICLSDPQAIKFDVQGKFAENGYLNNAISRSYYHRLYTSYSFSDSQTVLQVKDFILNNKLQYLVLTSGVPIDSISGLKLSNKFYDPNTKERFWVIDRGNFDQGK